MKKHICIGYFLYIHIYIYIVFTYTYLPKQVKSLHRASDRLSSLVQAQEAQAPLSDVIALLDVPGEPTGVAPVLNAKHANT